MSDNYFEPNSGKELMADNEEELILECAYGMLENIELQIQNSRNEYEIMELKRHRAVVNLLIRKNMMY